MTDNENTTIRNVLMYNAFIMFVIAIITLGGAWLTGTMWGLISIFLLFLCSNVRYK